MNKDRYIQNLEKLKRHIPDIDFFSKHQTTCVFKSSYKKAINSLDEIRDESQVICIYGVGDGLDYFELKQWLQKDKDRFLVFLEDDPKALAFFLMQKKASTLLDDLKVKFYFLESAITLELYLKKIAWEFVSLHFQLFIHPSYQKKKQAGSLINLFDKICLGCLLVASDYSDMGVSVMKNSLKNLKDLSKLWKIQKTETPFFNIPAIICGAGSSIEKVRDKLPLFKDRFLTFSGGAGLNVLSHINITPHFGAIIDKQSIFEGFIRQDNFQLPYFFLTRASYDCVRLIHAEKMLFSDPFSYLYEKWINQQLAKDLFPVKETEAGWNVVTFLLQIAIDLGCNPIVFAGVDLCLRDKRFYASGVEEAALHAKESSHLIQVKDQYGEQVLTQKDWYIAAKYIEEITSRHEDRDFLTLSEGLNLGQKVKPFDEKLSLFPSLDLDGMVHLFFHEKDVMLMPKKKVRDVINMIEIKLETSKENLQRFLVKLEKLYHQGIFEEKFEENLNDPWAIEYLFSPLWHMLKSAVLRAGNFSYPTLQKAIFLKHAVESHLKMIREITHEL